MFSLTNAFSATKTLPIIFVLKTFNEPSIVISPLPYMLPTTVKSFNKIASSFALSPPQISQSPTYTFFNVNLSVTSVFTLILLILSNLLVPPYFFHDMIFICIWYMHINKKTAKQMTITKP